MKRIVALIAVVVAIGGVLLWMRGGSDEGRIRAQLDRLTDALRMSEGANVLLRGVKMRREFGGIFEEDVRMDIAELPVTLPNERGALADEATRISAMFGTIDVELSDIDIKMDDAKTTAHVGATAKLSAKGRGEGRHDSRSTDFLFHKQDGDWRIASITVWTKTDAPPP